MIDVQVVVSLVEAIGLLALLAISFGTIERARIRPVLRSCLSGVLFGGGALVAMTSPAQIAEGVNIDGRSMIIGLAAAFGGPPAAIISAAMAASYRIWLGGVGTAPGVIGLSIAALAGLVWSAWLRPSGRLQIKHLTVLGGLISCFLLSAFYLAPDRALAMLATSGWMLGGAAVIGSVVLGLLIDRELALIERERHWKQQAMTDALTGLANRRGFERTLERKILADATAAAGAVVLIADIDHFKKVNDTFGHAAGDEALRTLARILAASVGHDAVARLGGEEFAILLPDTSPARARQIANAIRRSVEARLVTHADDAFGFTVSIGGTSSQPGDTVELLLQRADAALYAAKRAGRNQVKLGTGGDALPADSEAIGRRAA